MKKEENNGGTSKDCEPSENLSGVKTINSTMSMAEYFNSKKSKSNFKCNGATVCSAGRNEDEIGFKFNFTSDSNPHSSCPTGPKSKLKKGKRTTD